MKKSVTSAVLFAMTLMCCAIAVGQASEKVLYSFGAFPEDGIFPSGGLTLDPAGNIYGVTAEGGKYCMENGGCGTVYELSPSQGGGWTETILYNFCTTGNPSTCPDGWGSLAGLFLDQQGNLYGTAGGGGSNGLGVVFKLSPPTGGGNNWTETVLWNFGCNKDNGCLPRYGKLNMDAAGNIYGATSAGGKKNAGIVFQLKPVGDGTYSFSILHSFSGPDGAQPQYGVAIDNSGALYGATIAGGKSSPNCNSGPGTCGVVYKLTQSNGVWTESVLYKLNGITEWYPVTPISIDQDGNLYGTFMEGGGGGCFGGCGGIFKLIPSLGKKQLFYFNGAPGEGGPKGGVLVAKDGSLIGVASDNGAHPGDVFRVKGKTEEVLYKFCSLPNCTDGSTPLWGTPAERSGVLYGTTSLGGDNNLGVVYTLTK